jgi:hypothetical protein
MIGRVARFLPFPYRMGGLVGPQCNRTARISGHSWSKQQDRMAGSNGEVRALVSFLLRLPHWYNEHPFTIAIAECDTPRIAFVSALLSNSHETIHAVQLTTCYDWKRLLWAPYPLAYWSFEFKTLDARHTSKPGSLILQECRWRSAVRELKTEARFNPAIGVRCLRFGFFGPSCPHHQHYS